MVKKDKFNIFYIIGFLLGLFLFGPITKPTYFDQIRLLATVYTTWKRVAEVLSVYLIIFIISRNKKSLKIKDILLPLLIIIYYVYYLILTFIYRGEVNNLFRQFISCVYVCATFYLALTWTDESLLTGGLFLFEFDMFINLFFLITRPEGFYYKSFGFYSPFLENKNTILRFLFPGLFFALVLDFIQKKKISIRTWIYLITLLITAIIAESSTSIIATSLLILSMLVFGNMNHISTKISIKLFFIISLIVLLFIIILQVSSPFLVYLTGILNRDITFTGRIYLWSEAVSYIQKRPIFGYGYEGVNVLNNMFYAGGFSSQSCHNFYLDLAYRSGLFGLSIIFLIILQADKKMKNPLIDDKVRLSFILISLIYFISWNFEVFVDDEIFNVLGYFLLLYYLWAKNSLVYRSYNR